jgi:hypothetical protein
MGEWGWLRKTQSRESEGSVVATRVPPEKYRFYAGEREL